MDKEVQEMLTMMIAENIAKGSVPADAVRVPPRGDADSDHMGNINIDAKMLRWVRQLPDFDLIMFLSELSQFGWDNAQGTIKAMREAKIDLIKENK